MYLFLFLFSLLRLCAKFNKMLNTMIEDSQHFISEDENRPCDEEKRIKEIKYDVISISFVFTFTDVPKNSIFFISN